MESLIISKLIIARDALKLTQSAAGRASGFRQNGISIMEKGRKHNVPLRYITFLASKGINLTALFDDNITPDEFARVATQRSGLISVTYHWQER